MRLQRFLQTTAHSLRDCARPVTVSPRLVFVCLVWGDDMCMKRHSTPRDFYFRGGHITQTFFQTSDSSTKGSLSSTKGSFFLWFCLSEVLFPFKRFFQANGDSVDIYNAVQKRRFTQRVSWRFSQTSACSQ